MIRELTEADLPTILKWRNHPDIRKWMLNSHEIELNEHLSWYKTSKESGDKSLLIFCQKKIPLGFIQFSGLKEKNGILEWGFYISPYAKRGLGKIMAVEALQYIFRLIKPKKIIGYCLSNNELSIIFHKKIGFKEIESESDKSIKYFYLNCDEITNAR